MAKKSKYDFVGGYDYVKACRYFARADPLLSPGKKQWTWGSGDFGNAWDRNLTDEDGHSRAEDSLMFTDNQPDIQC